MLTDEQFEYYMRKQAIKSQKPLWKEQREIREELRQSRQEKSFDRTRTQNQKIGETFISQNRSFSNGKSFKESDYSPEGPLPRIFYPGSRKNNYSTSKKDFVLDK